MGGLARGDAVPAKCAPMSYLKVRYGAANGRLRNVQSPRSFAIALPLHNCREVSKMAQFHADALFLSM
jgi:hypothetical protein